MSDSDESYTAPLTTTETKRTMGKSSEKSFVCDFNGCSKAFARRSDFTRHYRIHTNDRPYECSECGKAFIQKSALTVHFRVHTGEKPHKCKICLRAFSDSSSLSRHRRTHTGARPYHCPEDGCGRSFCRKATLAKHITRCHGYDQLESAVKAGILDQDQNQDQDQEDDEDQDSTDPVYGSNSSEMHQSFPSSLSVSVSPLSSPSSQSPMDDLQSPTSSTNSAFDFRPRANGQAYSPMLAPISAPPHLTSFDRHRQHLDSASFSSAHFPAYPTQHRNSLPDIHMSYDMDRRPSLPAHFAMTPVYQQTYHAHQPTPQSSYVHEEEYTYLPPPQSLHHSNLEYTLPTPFLHSTSSYEPSYASHPLPHVYVSSASSYPYQQYH